MRCLTTTSLPRIAAAAAVSLAAPRVAHAQAPAAAAALTAPLIGRVVDPAQCVPVAGAVVRLDGRAADTTRDDGRFRFAGVAGGAHQLVVRRAGLLATSATATVTPPALGYAEVRLGGPGTEEGAATAGGDTAAVVESTLPGGVAITAVPAQPTPGTLFRLRAVLPADAPPEGTFAGERLHFVRVAPRTFEALAAVPVDAPSSLWAAVGGDSVSLGIARATYPLERLRVAPEFGREPDLALAERLERESEKARDVGCRAHLTPRLWTGEFRRPRPSRITSGFGRGREYNGTVTSRHTGTDFAGATGAPIQATNRGVVRLIDRFYLGGNVVYLDHGAGLVSAYLHLSRTLVAVGDTVQRGQVIGRVGSTGRVTGPHLHWVVRYGRISVDPMSLLAVAADSAARREGVRADSAATPPDSSPPAPNAGARPPAPPAR